MRVGDFVKWARFDEGRPMIVTQLGHGNQVRCAYCDESGEHLVDIRFVDRSRLVVVARAPPGWHPSEAALGPVRTTPYAPGEWCE